MEKVTNKLKDMEHLSSYSMYVPIIDSLVQVASEFTEPSAVNEILVLLKALR